LANYAYAQPRYAACRWWWRVLTRSGGSYTYLQVKAVALWSHPDVDTAQDLAELKTRFLCRDVSRCTLQAPQQTVLGGVPATSVDAVLVRQFGEQKSISGVSTDEGDKTADELTWSTRDVFLVKGNYGYNIRLASTDTLTSRVLADLDQALATLQFYY
jgi:hypothetical protein